MNSYKELRVADIEYIENDIYIFDEYQLTNAQLFIKNLFNPNTLYKTLLINWQTGVGKSIAAISIGNEFIKNYQLRNNLGEKNNKFVYVLGFSTSETIQADLISYPELGYVTKEEVQEFKKLVLNDDSSQSQYLSMLHKRLTNKSLGGNYVFMGYREFANNLFMITPTGMNKKITIQSLFEYNEDENFNIDTYIKLNYIQINKTLINNLKNGLIIADEIHNVYNSLDVNNYGLAIQYILNSLKENAPRTVYMSATPITGNASEIVDLLNLLNPNADLKRYDFFNKNSDEIYELQHDTLEKISKLSSGKVSFLLDTNTELYPTRIFVGEYVNQVPYIKLNVCNLSNFFQKTVDSELQMHNSIGINSYTLYDIAFPNPHSENIGLYSDIFNTLQNASNEWKTKTGINIYNTSDNITIITGDFLHKNNLKKYSEKYYNVLIDILDNIKNKKEGKIMIYHHKVQTSGVLLLQEIFKLNGFIDESSEPISTTLCVICGIEFGDHENKNIGHIFKPCRFIMAHSKLNKSLMKRNIIKFNDISNLYGTEYKLLIGSRVIKEGLNFTAIRWQYIMSLPINFPILIQILGRVIRKNSHIKLPKDQQNVYIKIYANRHELPRYILKAKEYLIIQEVERALRVNAIDNFINYKKTTKYEDSLESLVFVPKNIDKPPIDTKYFDAYDYNLEEINIIKKLIFLVFKHQNIWKYEDLWDQIHKISNVNYNSKLINKNNFDIALYELDDIDNINDKYLIKNDKYLTKNSNIPDIEYYFRNSIDNEFIVLDLTSYLLDNKLQVDFSKQIPLVEEYLNNFIELLITDFSYDFHIFLLRKIIVKEKIMNSKGNMNNMEKIIDLYKRFKILIFNNKTPIGYVDKLSVVVYENKKWIDKPLETFYISQRFKENNYIIGYMEEEKIKLRKSIKDENLKNEKKDLRSIKKGSVCTTYLQTDLLDILDTLRDINKNNKNYAYKYDKTFDKKLSISQICKIIKVYLLYFEEKSRSSIDGMKKGLKWLYIFNENLPTLAVK